MCEMKLQRDVVKIRRGFASHDEPSPLSKEELLASVWDMTAEVYSLTGTHSAQSRLQRDVVSIARRAS